MPSWKTHQNFGLFSYGIYILAVSPGHELSLGVAVLSIPVALVGAMYPDILDPPNGWKHRARGHAQQRLKKYFVLTVVLYPISLFVPFVVPVMAYLIGYISHLVADSTTPSGLTNYPSEEGYPLLAALQRNVQKLSGGSTGRVPLSPVRSMCAGASSFAIARPAQLPARVASPVGPLPGRMTFKELNDYLMHARGWADDPRAGGRALYGLAVSLKDIPDNMPVRYTTVSIDRNGRMQHANRAHVRCGAPGRYLRQMNIVPSKDVETLSVNDDDKVRDDMLYIDNCFISRNDPTRLRNLYADTTGVVVRFK
jgi:hypothetical protein